MARVASKRRKPKAPKWYQPRLFPLSSVKQLSSVEQKKG